MNRSPAERRAWKAGQDGTILVVVAIIVFSVAALSAVALNRASQTHRSHAHSVRVNLSENTARSALDRVMGQIENRIKQDSYQDEGTLHGETNEVTFTSKGLGHIIIDGYEDLAGDVRYDQLANSEDLVNSTHEIGTNEYRGGIFRVIVQEWSLEASGQRIGADGIDDNDSGQVDEQDEVPGYSREANRRFTALAYGSYGNFTTVLTAYFKTSARDGFGVYAYDNLEVRSDVQTQAFNSQTGESEPGMGHVGGGDITLRSGASIDGNAQFQNSGTDHGATVNGYYGSTDQPMEEQTFESKSLGLTNDAQTGSGTLTVSSDGDSTTVDHVLSADEQFENIQVESGAWLEIEAGNRIDVEMDIDVGNQGKITQTQGSGTFSELVVGGNVSLGDDGIMNLSDASNRFSVGGSVTLLAGASFSKNGGDWYVGGEYDTRANTETILENPSDSETQQVYIGNTMGLGEGHFLAAKGSTVLDVGGLVAKVGSSPFQFEVRSERYEYNPDTGFEDGYVELSSRGNIDLKSESEIYTTTNQPSALKMDTGGDFIVREASNIEAAISAHQGTVDIKGYSTVKGSIVGQNVELKENVDFHFDTAAPMDTLHYVNLSTVWIRDRRGGPVP